jgi:hypothetical protein
MWVQKVALIVQNPNSRGQYKLVANLQNFITDGLKIILMHFQKKN